jgi:GT2 family glycosyltransferase
MSDQRLAVLLTCHNRREQTLACLHQVSAQAIENVAIDVVVVDDGSTDGTSAAIRERFPGAQIIQGSGSLYWNGGMCLAFEHAIRGAYDYYLLLNDDTCLAADALAKLFATHTRVSANGRPCIVIGSTRDPGSGKLSYGGWRSVSAFSRIKCRKIEPTSEPQRCDTMNANCVLIPREVVERVGILDSRFTHSIGDFDYGFRASQANCELWIAPGYVGTCLSNPGAGNWKDGRLSVRQRWQRILGPKGLPLAEWLLYTRRHAGTLWPLYWVNPYLRFLARTCASAISNRFRV